MLIGTARTRRKGQRWFDQRRRLVELVDPVKLLIGRSSAAEHDDEFIMAELAMLAEPGSLLIRLDMLRLGVIVRAADDGVWQYT